MQKFLITFLMSMFFCITAKADSFIAKVNRNPVPLGETFVLTLQYEGNPGTSQPEFSSLNKDFTIYSVGREYKSNTINGKTNRFYSWNVVLSPKVSGEVIIPSISFKNLSTNPIKVKVAAENANGSVLPKFAIGRMINNDNPLVQEQIIYTLVLKTAEQLQGNLPQFVDNGNKDWIIKQLGDPVVSTEIDNGIENKKIEIKYAFFPQKSGKLTIPELHFKGYYIDENKIRNSHSSMFDVLFNGGFSGIGTMNPAMSSINLVAQPVNVEVRAIPTINNGYWWLPSSKVEISSDWDGQLPKFKVGEAVNRKITLYASGVADTQLPNLEFVETDKLKQYPENPQIESVVTTDGIVSKMEVNVVYIPEQRGKMTIPAISVPWYNILSQKMEKAILPEVVVDVIGVPDKVVKDALSAKTTSQIQEIASRKDGIEEQTLPLKMIIGLVALAFALGLSASYVLLKVQQFRNNSKDTPQPQQPDIKKAIRSKDLKIIREEVLLWARQNNPSAVIRNLEDVDVLYNDSDLSTCLKQLTYSLYSEKQNEFDFPKLEKVMSALTKKNKGSKNKKSLLPELYK